jgi:hypothetical protein
MAISDSTFRSNKTFAFFSAFMNRLYVSPCDRTAALILVIHKRRKLRLRFRRST